MEHYAIDTGNRGLKSRYLPDPDEKKDIPDRETLEHLANLMGVDIQSIEEQIAEQERLHKLAWKKPDKRRSRYKDYRKDHHVTQFIEVVSFQGKQLFWQLGANRFIVGAHGQTFAESTIKDALHRLACE